MILVALGGATIPDGGLTWEAAAHQPVAVGARHGNAQKVCDLADEADAQCMGGPSS